MRLEEEQPLLPEEYQQMDAELEDHTSLDEDVGITPASFQSEDYFMN